MKPTGYAFVTKENAKILENCTRCCGIEFYGRYKEFLVFTYQGLSINGIAACSLIGRFPNTDSSKWTKGYYALAFDTVYKHIVTPDMVAVGQTWVMRGNSVSKEIKIIDKTDRGFVYEGHHCCGAAWSAESFCREFEPCPTVAVSSNDQELEVTKKKLRITKKKLEIEEKEAERYKQLYLTTFDELENLKEELAAKSQPWYKRWNLI